MTIEIGQRLGPYEIEAPAGKGGMGEVYLAEDGKRVASGIYFYRLQANDFVHTRKMLLLK